MEEIEEMMGEKEKTKTVNIPLNQWRELMFLKTELNVRAMRDVLQMLVDNYNAKK